MIFYKTVSAGNDFIQVDLGDDSLQGRLDKSILTRALCHPKNGPGADGVIFRQVTQTTVQFSIFNRDGTEAELSGNGMAGCAAILFYLGQKEGSVNLETKVGSRTISLIERNDNRFRLDVEIGKPDFSNHILFPFLETGQMDYKIEGITFTPVSVGNPHAVVLLDHEIPEEELLKTGEKLERAAIFPQRTNVEFVSQMGTNTCRAFFYERGVGPTGSSSTGSSAVFAVLREKELIRDRLAIDTPMGAVKISGTHGINVENYTEIVYKGTYLSLRP